MVYVGIKIVLFDLIMNVTLGYILSLKKYHITLFNNNKININHIVRQLSFTCRKWYDPRDLKLNGSLVYCM